MKSNKHFDVIVVGAGAAGVGTGMALKHVGIDSMILLERGKVGESFSRWPKEMRFITPSFTSNSFGFVDLNAVHPLTSPALSLDEEHPAGQQYAKYLDAVARWADLPVRTGVDVQSVSYKNKEFSLETNEGTYTTSFMVWAAGELQYPQKSGFTGAELCVHNSKVESWHSWKGESIAIIGGNESGIDAAYHLSRAGKAVVVIDPAAPWEKSAEIDPSLALSPYTVARFRQMVEDDAKKRVSFIAGKVQSVEEQNGQFIVRTQTRDIPTDSPPVLATGFLGSLFLICDLLDWDAEGGFPILTQKADESTLTPGLFISGPMVRHRTANGVAVFCFIYKFRMRFSLIATEIAWRMHLDPSPLLEYDKANMVLRDLVAC